MSSPAVPHWKQQRQEVLQAHERRKKEEADAKTRKVNELRMSASSFGVVENLSSSSSTTTTTATTTSDAQQQPSLNNSFSSASPAPSTASSSSSSSPYPSSPPSSSSSLSTVSSVAMSSDGAKSPSSVTRDPHTAVRGGSSNSGSVPKWKQLQLERQQFDANLKQREKEAKLKKLADLGLLVKPSVGVEPPEGIPNPKSVSQESGASLQHSHIVHVALDKQVAGAASLQITVDQLPPDDDRGAVPAADAAAAAAAAEQAAAAAAAQFAAFAAQEAAAQRGQQAQYRAALPFPSDIGKDIDDPRAHVMRLLQPVGSLNGIQLDGFDLEYEYLSERQLQAPAPEYTTALLEPNLAKNRYTNILPPERTRVKLALRNDDPHSDYINANLLGARSDMPQRYISCQGPLESTSSDMWRMIWQYNSSVVVMLTREIEKGFIKCDRYWPDPTTPGMIDDEGVCRAQYGDIVVTFVDEAAGDEFVVRRFDLFNVAEPNNAARRVTQLMYFGWPDHGIPASRAGFLQLCALADSANTSGAPLVVHCSAGVGRTGTFCAVHGALERFMADLNRNAKPLINILESVREMREARLGMVQTKEQYVFAYLAVLEQTELWLFERGMLPDDAPGASADADAVEPTTPSDAGANDTNNESTSQRASTDVSTEQQQQQGINETTQ